MRFERVSGETHRMYKRAMELYKISFPPHEQRAADSQARILGDEDYRFALAYDEDTFVGMILYWSAHSFIYVEHLCILPEMRNKHYGQKVLELLGSGGKKVILEIDPPVDDISARRRGFYERCGFKQNPYPHIHPPYHRDNKGHPLVIMSSPAQITAEEYGLFKRYLERRVMADVY